MFSPRDYFLHVLPPFEELKKLEPVINPLQEVQHKGAFSRPFSGRDKRTHTLTHVAAERG